MTTQQEAVYMEINVNGFHKVFANFDELNEWVVSTHEKWSFADPGQYKSTTLNELRANPDNQTRKNQFKTMINSYLHRIYPDSSREAQFLFYIKDSLSGDCAKGAYAFLKNVHVQPSHSAQLIAGAALAANFKLGEINLDYSSAATNAVLTEADAAKAKIQKEALELRKSVEDQKAKHNETWNDLEKSASDNIENFKKETEVALQNVIKSSKKLEDDYNTKFSLQAPASYWTEKANDHLKQSNKYRDAIGWVLGTGILTLIILVAVNINLDVIKFNANDISSLILEKIFSPLSGTILVVVILVIWLSRILTKLMLSNIHLHEKAREKAVMTTTYLALAEANHVDEKEHKLLILESLFQQTNVGAIEDEGPQLPLGIISSLVKSK